MPNRGSINTRTGKTTPRSKGRTHWSAKGSSRHSKSTVKSAKPAAAKPAAAAVAKK